MLSCRSQLWRALSQRVHKRIVPGRPASPAEESPRMSVGFLRISSFAEGPAAVVARGRSVAADEGKGSWLRQADAVGGVNSAREQASSVGGGTGNNCLVHMEEGVQVYRWKWEETSKVKERHGKRQSEEASNEGTNAQPLTMGSR